MGKKKAKLIFKHNYFEILEEGDHKKKYSFSNNL